MLENVEEFKTWGPVRHGKPVKSKAGRTFAKFIGQLQELGYAVEYKELIAADYGAPTTRKRFVLIARCDGAPIVWPSPTHSRNGEGGLPKWRSAAEVIDWTLPCPSIFASKEEIRERYGVSAVRPLAENTVRRVIRGVDKFTIRSGNPFIVPTGYGERKGQAPRIHDITAPMPTIVGSGKHNLCDPILAPITISNTGSSVGADAGSPVHTVRTGGGGQVFVASSLIQYHTEQTEHVRANGIDAPIPTVDASNRYGLTSASLVEYYSTGRPLSVEGPLHTATSHDREALTTAHIVKFKGDNLGQSLNEPMQTITTSAGEFARCNVFLVKVGAGENLGYWPKIRSLLNRYCGYNLASDEVLLLSIAGALYYIADIGLRMLTPKELYAAMGFPKWYIIERDYTGKPYPKSKQVARCGNAVCPDMARELVKANLPEYCRKEKGNDREASIR